MSQISYRGYRFPPDVGIVSIAVAIGVDPIRLLRAARGVHPRNDVVALSRGQLLLVRSYVQRIVVPPR